MIPTAFDPIQPFFVFNSEQYYKKVITGTPVAHLYRFTSKSRTQVENAVVPDGSVDVIFTCDSLHPQAIVAGSVKMASLNGFQEDRSYFGVRFVPGAFERFGNVSAGEIIGENADFLDVTGKRDVLERICTASSFDDQIVSFMEGFHELFSTEAATVSPLVAEILAEIFRCSGNIRVQELESMLHYSRRHLTRVFSAHVGMDIKHFSKIIRFQTALSRINHGQYSSLADVFLDSGYYDQTHFQKDFRQFSMMTPGVYRNLIDSSDYLHRITVVE